MRVLCAVFTALALVAPLPLAAQTRDETLADIRQELNILFVEIQKLKRELSTTGSPQVNLAGSSVLDRVAAMEAELQRLTSETEQLENRVNRVVTDGTNRIGDLEFRLVELEGGDVSKLSDTTTLGGVEPTAAAPLPGTQAPTSSQPQLAVGEEADYQAAMAALDEGDYRKAADLLATFNQSYPGSPLAAEADLKRGHALDQLGDTREAARAYLSSFNLNATGPVAPDALYQLGAALGRLGQTQQACITLGEVGSRFPAGEAALEARNEMSKLGCT
ncbi:tol-pal system protein YbgF [Pseudooceanicola sp.]|uniref:tol-pal system protein YbgF n=1 Tax=Pseudooceanicola sp. TaxID=1914328 RepID=UPI003510E924